jgi:hypothetical protein
MMRDGLLRLPGADQASISQLANIGSKLLRSGREQIQARRGRDDRVSAIVLAVTQAQDSQPDRGTPTRAYRVFPHRDNNSLRQRGPKVIDDGSFQMVAPRDRGNGKGVIG